MLLLSWLAGAEASDSACSPVISIRQNYLAMCQAAVSSTRELIPLEKEECYPFNAVVHAELPSVCEHWEPGRSGYCMGERASQWTWGMPASASCIQQRRPLALNWGAGMISAIPKRRMPRYWCRSCNRARHLGTLEGGAGCYDLARRVVNRRECAETGRQAVGTKFGTKCVFSINSILKPAWISGFGERGRNRTFNLLIKSQLLCQLSYAPVSGLSFSPGTRRSARGYGLHAAAGKLLAGTTNHCKYVLEYNTGDCGGTNAGDGKNGWNYGFSFRGAGVMPRLHTRFSMGSSWG